MQLSVLSKITSKSGIISLSEEAWADLQQAKFENKCSTLYVNDRGCVRQIDFYFFNVSHL